MKQIALGDAGSLAEYVAGGLTYDERVAITDGPKTVGVVVAPATLAALQNTVLLLATNGALASISQGVADLAAGRTEDWRVLRRDYGRGANDEPAPSGAAPAIVSYTARWDLELLVPHAAQRCFDLLDALPEQPVAGDLLGAGFNRLLLLVQDGYRLVFRRDAADGVEIVHVDASPE